jgi:hypothetical protein
MYEDIKNEELKMKIEWGDERREKIASQIVPFFVTRDMPSMTTIMNKSFQLEMKLKTWCYFFGKWLI